MFTERELELIEKLKGEKQYAFGLLSDEERDICIKVGFSNCEFLGGSKEAIWIKLTDEVGEFTYWRVYRIKPDYHPKPEYEDIEIIHIKLLGQTEERLGISLRGKLIRLHEIVDMPGFVEFIIKLPNGTIVQRFSESIASEIHSGRTVYARFRQ